MSAYMVGKNHIAFLIAAANRCQPRSYGLFKWRHDGEWHQLDRHTEERVAQMLMDANLESVSTRYPNEIDLPGPVNEGYLFGSGDLREFPEHSFKAAQVVKACHCFEYQSCEFEGWHESEAKAFIEALIDATCKHLPGYDDALWGAPDPTPRHIGTRIL